MIANGTWRDGVKQVESDRRAGQKRRRRSKKNERPVLVPALPLEWIPSLCSPNGSARRIARGDENPLPRRFSKPWKMAHPRGSHSGGMRARHESKPEGTGNDDTVGKTCARPIRSARCGLMFPWSDSRLWLAGGAAAVLSGMAKSGVPGLGILAIPLMAMVLPAKASVGALLPILIIADVFAIALHRRHAQWHQIFRLLPWVAVGMVAAYFALGSMEDRTVRPALGTLVMVMLILEAVRRKLAWDRLPHHPVFSAVTGVAGGFATTLGNAAGPIMNIYLLARGLSKEAFMGTAAWYFFIVNLVKVPIFAFRGMITHDSLVLNAAVSPLVALGAWLGYAFVSRISPRVFLAVVFVLTAVAALHLFR